LCWGRRHGVLLQEEDCVVRTVMIIVWLTNHDVAYVVLLHVQDYYNKRKLVLLAVSSKAKKKDAAASSCIVYKPNTGRQARLESFTEIRKKYRRVMDYDAARYHWEDLYDSSSACCLHAYMYVMYKSVVPLVPWWPKVCHNNGSCAGSPMLYGYFHANNYNFSSKLLLEITDCLLFIFCWLTHGEFGMELTHITAEYSLNAVHARISIRTQLERHEIYCLKCLLAHDFWELSKYFR